MTWNQVLPTNQWSHLALVIPADNSRISASEMYVNGVKQTTFNSGSSTTRTNSYFDPGTDFDVRIGADHFSCFFKGEMDDIRFHSRALGSQELGYHHPGEAGGLSSLTFPRSSAGMGPYSDWFGPLYEYGNPDLPGHLGLEVTDLGALRLSISGSSGSLVLSTAKHVFNPDDLVAHHVAVRARAGAPISPSPGILDERFLSSYDIFFDGVSLPLTVERTGTDLGLSSSSTLADGSVFSVARNSEGEYLPGSVDEVAIWSRPMSTDQILALSVALYDHSVDDGFPRPDHAWSFEEVESGSFRDYGGAVSNAVTEWELIAKHTGSNTNRFPSSARTDYLVNADDSSQPMFMSIGNLDPSAYVDVQGQYQ
ncbi:MAG TPA: LamG-like jellyroll fold domain-containing protein, partial [Candidatus Poseidoniales archaeon]|nr:LamG-like jellyroll fold domain-containing protein [Candidatus Poseidoniales archaeon]